MPRHWREQLDPSRHRRHVGVSNDGGVPPAATRDNLIEEWAYFVDVCSFTFEFTSLDEIRQALAFFRQKVHPSSRSPLPPRSHWYHAWHERLPQRLFEESKRDRVVLALERALGDFAQGKP